MEKIAPANADIPNPALLEAFHLMYDYFPEPAMLVHKSKRIAAVNLAAAAQGHKPGKLCALHGTPDLHVGCLSREALTEQAAQCKEAHFQGRDFVLCWLPVNGYPDYYVHFSMGNRDYTL